MQRSGKAPGSSPAVTFSVLDGVGAVFGVFQDVVSGRPPIENLSGLLAGETLVDRQAHAATAASGVHLHNRQCLSSAAGAHKSAHGRGQVAKRDLVGHGVEHRAGRCALKGQDVELHQVRRGREAEVAGLTPVAGDFAVPASLAAPAAQVDAIVSTASIGQVEGTADSFAKDRDAIAVMTKALGNSGKPCSTPSYALDYFSAPRERLAPA